MVKSKWARQVRFQVSKVAGFFVFQWNRSDSGSGFEDRPFVRASLPTVQQLVLMLSWIASFPRHMYFVIVPL